MRTITYTQVQKLVEQLPPTKLERAYNMILDLTEQKADTELTQVDFMKLSLSERRKIMKQQAKYMAGHYQKTIVEREEWQGGEFIDEY